MTCFTLAMGDEGEYADPEARREEILGRLERDETFRHELEGFHERGVDGHTNWHEHDRDTTPSPRRLEVHFVLWGEEPEDLWKCYDLGGRMQNVLSRIEYPPSDPDELVGPWPQPDESCPRRGSAAWSGYHRTSKDDARVA